MIYVAQVVGGVVAQVRVCGNGHIPDSGEIVIGPENVVGIGWTYQDGNFFAPLEEEYAPET